MVAYVSPRVSRNYLEHVSESIEEWTRGEEAKYQAMLLAQEVDKITQEAEEAASRPASGKGKKKDRSKSPKKSPSECSWADACRANDLEIIKIFFD